MDKRTMTVGLFIPGQTSHEAFIKGLSIQFVNDAIQDIGIKVIHLAIPIQVVHHSIHWIFVDEYVRRTSVYVVLTIAPVEPGSSGIDFSINPTFPIPFITNAFIIAMTISLSFLRQTRSV